MGTSNLEQRGTISEIKTMNFYLEHLFTFEIPNGQHLGIVFFLDHKTILSRLVDHLAALDTLHICQWTVFPKPSLRNRFSPNSVNLAKTRLLHCFFHLVPFETLYSG